MSTKDLTCTKCGRSCKNKQGLAVHENKCGQDNTRDSYDKKIELLHNSYDSQLTSLQDNPNSLVITVMPNQSNDIKLKSQEILDLQMKLRNLESEIQLLKERYDEEYKERMFILHKYIELSEYLASDQTTVKIIDNQTIVKNQIIFQNSYLDDHEEW